MLVFLSCLLGDISVKGGDSFCLFSTWLGYVNCVSVLIYGACNALVASLLRDVRSHVVELQC